MPGAAAPRGPLGDARPDAQGRPAAPTPGSLQPEKVEDRDNVGMVSPEDYPEDQRAKLDEGDANRGHRPGKGSGPVTGSGAGAGGKGNPEDFDADPQGGGGQAPKIGRASGRERVCQYVSISVAAASLNKTTSKTSPDIPEPNIEPHKQ